MSRTGIFMVGAALLSSGFAAAVEVTLRPGEYEMTTQTRMEGMDREIPPNTSRHCISAEEAKDPRRVAEHSQKKGSDCETKDWKKSGNHASWAMTCKSGAKGSAEMTFGTDGYDMTMTLEMSAGSQGPMKMKIHQTAKRVGDCSK